MLYVVAEKGFHCHFGMFEMRDECNRYKKLKNKYKKSFKKNHQNRDRETEKGFE